jgi:clan AA aspartic protease
MEIVKGRVTERLEALVTVRFASGQEVECLVDTGASCALVLPQIVVDEMGLPSAGYTAEVEMVGGELTTAELAFGELEWLGKVLPVEVIVSDDRILGTELLNDTKLLVDYHSRIVVITREEE